MAVVALPHAAASAGVARRRLVADLRRADSSIAFLRSSSRSDCVSRLSTRLSALLLLVFMVDHPGSSPLHSRRCFVECGGQRDVDQTRELDNLGRTL